MKQHIPNTLTLINMLLGLVAVTLLIGSNLPNKEIIAVILIMLGAIIDFFDGYIARKLDAVTTIGKQLDSFADLVTFGIAPICLANYIAFSILIAIPSSLFLLAGAYRLARYQINGFNGYFMGLPITIAGVLLAVWCLMLSKIEVHTVITALFIAMLAALMVSKIKVKKL